MREGRTEPFLGGHLADSSSAGKWGGIALEKCKLPAVFAPRHEHPEHFLSIVLSGTVRHEINTKGKNLRFISHPGRIILLLLNIAVVGYLVHVVRVKNVTLPKARSVAQASGTP